MAQKIKPLGDRILVQRVEAEEKTAGGIVLPDAAKEKPKEGEVIALGAGRVLDNGETVEFQVAKGDRVIFSSYAGTEVKLNGDEFLIMREEDVLGIVK
ncbi:MAG: co-chaperone GroES [Planctomycetota bacterium]|jgi:chaperonin GroES|nr:co-chaperone GroES [Planctomycetota bacterium]MDP7131231.1 co-chaperone GroES [Planctomycetota bacterium]MDP7252168.1 co-chaperone GroES [Planctomycetota bacterium]